MPLRAPRSDPAWRRFYDVINRAGILLAEGRITRARFTAIYEAARRRAYREEERRPANTR